MTYSADFIEKHRDINSRYGWWDSVYDDFHRICEILGIDLAKREPSFSGFWSQGDGASWAGAYHSEIPKYNTDPIRYYETAPAAIREYAPKDEELHRIADELCLLGRVYGPHVAWVERNGHHYVHDKTMYVNEIHPVYYEDEARWGDDVYLHIEEQMQELFRDLARWLYGCLEAEYDYLMSDEAVIDTLGANEIEEETDVVD